MVKNKDFLARPPIGSRHLYDAGRLDDSLSMYGVYFVEITRYIEDMPICRILQIIKRAPNPSVLTHAVGKEVFFITKIANDPNEILKEII